MYYYFFFLSENFVAWVNFKIIFIILGNTYFQLNIFCFLLTVEYFYSVLVNHYNIERVEYPT